MLKKCIMVVLCIALLCVALFGCAYPAAESAAPSASAEATPTPTPTPKPTPTPTPTPEPTRDVTDMAGRAVTLPMEIAKICGADTNADVFAYTLASGKMAGWSNAPAENQTVLLSEEAASLPAFSSGEGFDANAAAQAGAELILFTGDKETADALQDEAGIPVFAISGALADVPDAYRLLGSATGDQARANSLSSTAQEILDRAAAVEIPEDDQFSTYYGYGQDSLELAQNNGLAAQAIAMAGGVYAIGLEQDNPPAPVYVALDQLVKKSPSVMFVGGDPANGVSAASAMEYIQYNPAFLTIRAAKKDRLFGVPDAPFSWLGGQSAVSNLLGVLWAGSVMYPDAYAEVDVVREINDFYDLFYGARLPDGQVMEMAQITLPEEEPAEVLP